MSGRGGAGPTISLPRPAEVDRPGRRRECRGLVLVGELGVREQRRLCIVPRYTLETIILILIILWLLGWLVVPSLGNVVHLLLVIILIVVVVRLLQGRSPLP